MNGKIAVICSSRSQYDQFVRHWVEHSDQEKFALIQYAGDIRGGFFISVIRIGDYWMLRHHLDIYNELLARVEMNLRGNGADVTIFAGCFNGKDIHVTKDVKEVIDRLQYELETLRAELRLRN